jgi:hypothetical protein
MLESSRAALRSNPASRPNALGGWRWPMRGIVAARGRDGNVTLTASITGIQVGLVSHRSKGYNGAW